MCKPLTTRNVDRREVNEGPPNGKEKRVNGDSYWRSMVDWGVRLILVIMAVFLNSLRGDIKDLNENIDNVKGDVTQVRIDLSASLQANLRQDADIERGRQTDADLVRLLNELTRNVAALTERVANNMGRIERGEGSR